jgi:hypothetical protein
MILQASCESNIMGIIRTALRCMWECMRYCSHCYCYTVGVRRGTPVSIAGRLPCWLSLSLCR